MAKVTRIPPSTDRTRRTRKEERTPEEKMDVELHSGSTSQGN